MIHLGLSLTPFGHGPMAWQGAEREALSFDAPLKQVLLAEEAGFDFVWLADRMGERPADMLSPVAAPFEPTTLASALATRTKNIGLIATAATHQHEPYNLARRFASLDWISHGRAGWAIVAGTEDARDREYVELVSALWDSWEDDAFIYDKAAGRFFVPDKMHVLNHKGANFSVRGPLNVNRSPQGKPVLAAVSNSPVAHLADVIFVLDGAPIADVARERAEVRVIKSVTDFTGVAADVADIFERELESGIDGFLLMPSRTAELGSFIETVLPELKKRGLFVAPPAGTGQSHMNAGDATPSLFSPAGRSAERMRGDEGVFEHSIGASRTPSSGPAGHLLPAGEKREKAASPPTNPNAVALPTEGTLRDRLGLWRPAHPASLERAS
jgi:alkanesulfonate monooxygenase SsuD/methylene tetrahydromethanopterin reductase-like flavin-dependent oxidoreductase (luciferase family)